MDVAGKRIFDLEMRTAEVTDNVLARHLASPSGPVGRFEGNLADRDKTRILKS